MNCEHRFSPVQNPLNAQDYITGDIFSIHRCVRCGLFLTHPAPPLENIDRYYPKNYYGDTSNRRFPWWVEFLQGQLYVSRVRKLETYSPVKGTVIDIGCGKGFLLNAFQKKGWKVQGIELSETAARHARVKFGINVHIGSVSNPTFDRESFDAAILWHVLEHTDQPGQMLMDLWPLLKPNGMLLLGVPNWGCPEARLSKSRWFHLDVPRHLAHFTEASLTQLLKNSGFEVVRRFRFAPEFDLFSFVQTSLNRLGLPQNHLYRMLRGHGAKLKHLDDRHWHVIASFLLAIPLALIGLLWIPLAGLFGWGSSLTYLVKKTASLR